MFEKIIFSVLLLVLNASLLDAAFCELKKNSTTGEICAVNALNKEIRTANCLLKDMKARLQCDIKKVDMDGNCKNHECIVANLTIDASFGVNFTLFSWFKFKESHHDSTKTKNISNIKYLRQNVNSSDKKSINITLDLSNENEKNGILIIKHIEEETVYQICVNGLGPEDYAEHLCCEITKLEEKEEDLDFIVQLVILGVSIAFLVVIAVKNCIFPSTLKTLDETLKTLSTKNIEVLKEMVAEAENIERRKSMFISNQTSGEVSPHLNRIPIVYTSNSDIRGSVDNPAFENDARDNEGIDQLSTNSEALSIHNQQYGRKKSVILPSIIDPSKKIDVRRQSFFFDSNAFAGSKRYDDDDEEYEKKEREKRRKSMLLTEDFFLPSSKPSDKYKKKKVVNFQIEPMEEIRTKIVQESKRRNSVYPFQKVYALENFDEEEEED